jgi:aspartate/methionine/tyrosine aminotransferase
LLQRIPEAHFKGRSAIEPVSHVNAIDGLSCLTPEGTYYVWVDHRDLCRSSRQFQRHCLEHGITFNPGTAFGVGGEGFARLSCSPTPEVLATGLGRLAEAATTWRQPPDRKRA